MKSLGWDMPKTKGKGWSNHGRDTIRTIPCCHSDWLLATTVPLTRNNTEQGETASFEQTKEETGGKEFSVAVACGHTSLGDSPTEDERGHQDTVGDLDNQDHGEGLPCQLRNGCNGTNKRILVPREVGVFLKTENCTITKDWFIENLDEDGS
jgi:hypothetical protein